jgi:predicted Zn-dependent protease
MLRAVAVCAVCVAVVLSFPEPAEPCGNPIAMRGNKAVQKVMRAEKHLAKGNLAKAIREVQIYDFEWEDKALERRAHTAYYAASVRAGRESAYQEAEEFFQSQLEQDKEQPLMQARLAEVYLARNQKITEARAMLEDLFARDLVPDAHGYVTLAQLRDREGDAGGRDDALTRCRTATKNKRQCALPKKKATAAKA